MNTIFLTEKSSNIAKLNSDIERLSIEGYKVITFKVIGSAEHDKYNQYTIIVVQLNKE